MRSRLPVYTMNLHVHFQYYRIKELTWLQWNCHSNVGLQHLVRMILTLLYHHQLYLFLRWHQNLACIASQIKFHLLLPKSLHHPKLTPLCSLTLPCRPLDTYQWGLHTPRQIEQRGLASFLNWALLSVLYTPPPQSERTPLGHKDCPRTLLGLFRVVMVYTVLIGFVS